MLQIRKAKMEEIDTLMNIYSIAREFMIKTNNPNQWGKTNPTIEMVKNDILNGNSYVLCNDSKIEAVFALIFGKDPTYSVIENGNWLNDNEYVTIHRIASKGNIHGVFNFVINYCKKFNLDIRIDTHNDNLVMQGLIEKNGFKKCGIIYLKNGSPRIAYQLVNEKNK